MYQSFGYVCAQGLYVRGRSNEKGNNNRDKSRGKSRTPETTRCFKCHELGHWKKDCTNKRVQTKKGNNNNNNNNKGNQEKSEASMASEETPDECWSVASNDENSSKWVLDTGCSYHMSPDRKWFTTYKEIDNSAVMMGNNNSCKTVGIGSVRIKMFDGIVRTLKDVRHVPDLRKNLISLGVLESKGCKIIAEGGALKVVSGSLVVMKGIRQNNCLYNLVGSTVTGDAAVGVNGSGKDPTECTKIWHMRLGHMSEKGLSLLGKNGLLKDMEKPCMEFCEHCVYGKAHRVSFASSQHSSRDILDYVHTDVWGPAKVASRGGSR